MTTVRIVDGLKYGFKFLGLSLGLLLVSGVFVVGGLAIAGDPVLSLRGGALVLTPNLASASQAVLGGFAVVAIGALLWLAFSVGLLYKLIADAVSTGVGLSTHQHSPAVADADDAGDETTDATFAGGSDDETDADQGTAREPPAAATSSSEEDDVLSKMQASESSTSGPDETEPASAGLDRGDAAADAGGSGQEETRSTDPLSADERTGESVATESTGFGEDEGRDDGAAAAGGRDESADEPATEDPRPAQQRDFEREDAAQSAESVDEAADGADESDRVSPEEYDERGYPRRDSADSDAVEGADEPATGAADDTDPLNEPADPPEPSDEFVERTEESTEESVPLDEPLTDDDTEETPPGRSGSTPLDGPIDDAEDGDDDAVPLDEPITDADEDDETVPLDEPIDDASDEDETVPLDEPIEDSDVEDTTDEPGDWEPLDESDLKD